MELNQPYNAEKLLFHLSRDKGITKLKPRVPIKLWPEHEDKHVERVCFSDSINGCLRALFADEGAEYYIYVPRKQIEIYHPSDAEVIDKEITNEMWATAEVQVVNVGKLLVIGSSCNEICEKQEIRLPKTNFIYLIKNRAQIRMVI